MLRLPVAALIVTILPAGLASAQITDITTGRPPGADGRGVSLLGGHFERPMTAADIRAQDIERDYRRAMSKIPDKKPSKDPWAGVRATATTDRHRAE